MFRNGSHCLEVCTVAVYINGAPVFFAVIAFRNDSNATGGRSIQSGSASGDTVLSVQVKVSKMEKCTGCQEKIAPFFIFMVKTNYKLYI